MTNFDLSRDYLNRCRARLGAIDYLLSQDSFADVVRETQEAVELMLKGVLRHCQIDPPHWHDVSSILEEEKAVLPPGIAAELERIQKLSKTLRKERELAFYGDDDFIPGREYDREIAEKFITEAKWLFALVSKELSG